MRVVNALQIKQGAKVERNNRLGLIVQPLQFLPEKEKDDVWLASCVDYFEWQGIKQISRNAKRLLKNYKLARGIIDRNDYIVDETSDTAELVDTLNFQYDGANELKFYPIIPNVVNVLCAEFAKRNNTVSYRAVDDTSYNEQLEVKKEMVEEALFVKAQQKIAAAMVEQGVDPNDPEVQEALSPEKIQSMPEIESAMTKSYRSMCELWAQHQHNVDVERFKMDELEERAFRDKLITDREFWHFEMQENDYKVDIWNPITTFYHKSPSVRYTSEGNYVGKIDVMTASDVIDKYGYLMTEEELRSIELNYPVKGATYAMQGVQNDGSFYDPTRTHEWNTSMPSLGYRQFLSVHDDFIYGGDPIWAVYAESEDLINTGNAYFVRVTTVYWKTQRKVGHLTKITEEGEVIEKVVTESYKVTDKPLYDATLKKEKTSETLIFGEHIEWLWINEVYGATKIGPNRPSLWGMNNPGGFNPIYLGVGKDKPGRLKFQFKGNNNLYGCKLPVEGSVFNDRNTRSVSMVDIMKPYQVGYNIVNNQIQDILIDELGTVVLLDQNALPQHSLGEDWGKGNYAKAYVAMRDFSILPLDTTLMNTENNVGFNHYQVLNLEQTQRLMSRIQLAQYFKTQAFDVIGVNPQRMGQQIGQTQSATEVEQAVTGSYAQTEMMFVEHSDYLMPRVHQMRTDLAQFYHSTNPSTRLTYVTSLDEKVNFEINGTDLLLRDLNVFVTTKANHRALLEQLKSLAMSNNTANASIYDLANIIKSTSIAETDNILAKIEKQAQQNAQAAQEAEMQKQQQLLQAQEAEAEKERQFKLEMAQMDNENNIMVAQIRAAGYGSMQDINENKMSDYQDYMDRLTSTQQYQDQMNFNREKENNRSLTEREKLNLSREKLNVEREKARVALEIARENKTKSELEANRKNKEKENKSK
jgi:hypothetical protein